MKSLKINNKFHLFFVALICINLLFSQQTTHFQSNSLKVIKNEDTLLNPWTGGMNAIQISTIDLNNDQIHDLFVFDKTGNKILTFINTGSNYLYDPRYSMVLNVTPLRVYSSESPIKYLLLSFHRP